MQFFQLYNYRFQHLGSLEQIYQILHSAEAIDQYEQYEQYPVIAKRDSEGLLQISFSNLKPDCRSFKSNAQNLAQVITTSLSSSTLQNTKTAIARHVVQTMQQLLNQPEEGRGIWYPDDYEKYLNQRNTPPENDDFYTGFADPAFFEKTEAFTFKVKEGKKPSEAILSFLKGPTVADSANITMACYYKCVLNILGEALFNRLYSSEGFRLSISPYGIIDIDAPISFLADFTESAKEMATGTVGKRPLEIGQECYFGGVIWYGNKHPAGFGAGYNAVYVANSEKDEQLFIAQGFERPLTEKEISEKLIDCYNEERSLQDEKYLLDHPNNDFCDKNKNIFLKMSYTIKKEEVEKNPELFMRSFLVGSPKGLVAENILGLLTTIAQQKSEVFDD